MLLRTMAAGIALGLALTSCGETVDPATEPNGTAITPIAADPDGFIQQPQDLTANSWKVQSIEVGGISADAPVDAYFEFKPLENGQGVLAGDPGCNQFSTSWSFDDETDPPGLNIGDIAVTEMACVEPRVDDWFEFIDVLSGVNTWAVRGEVLELTDINGDTIIAIADLG